MGQNCINLRLLTHGGIYAWEFERETIRRTHRRSGSLDRGEAVYYITQVIEVRQTPAFALWLDSLRDRAAVARINVRIRRLSLGNLGDVRPVGAGVSELRIDYGPEYRVYFVHRGPETVVLLCGGDKSTQDRDIGRAKKLAKEDRDGA
jgi:putative addiction module killer protein